MQKKQSPFDFSLLTLLASNLFTVYLAIIQNWNLSEILLVYVIQSIIIGIFQFIKIIDLEKFSTQNFKINGKSVEPTYSTKMETAFFFLLHYGIFHLVYIFFVSKNIDFNTLPIQGILITSAGFFVNHLVSFLMHRKTDKKRIFNIGLLTLYPYARIIPMHLTIGIGTFLNTALFAFFGLKIFADIAMHLVEHQINQSPHNTIEANKTHQDQTLSNVLKTIAIILTVIGVGVIFTMAGTLLLDIQNLNIKIENSKSSSFSEQFPGHNQLRKVAAENTQKQEKSTYSNQEYGISFTYPSSYKIKEEKLQNGFRLIAFETPGNESIFYCNTPHIIFNINAGQRCKVFADTGLNSVETFKSNYSLAGYSTQKTENYYITKEQFEAIIKNISFNSQTMNVEYYVPAHEFKNLDLYIPQFETILKTLTIETGK